MAEILSGCSGHSSYAPLSQAQTVAVCSHLQEQISALQMRCTSFQEALDRNMSLFEEERMHVRLELQSVATLRESNAHCKSIIANLQNDVGSLKEVQRSHVQMHQRTGVDIAGLREAQRTSSTAHQQLLKEHGQTAAAVALLQDRFHQTAAEVDAHRDELSSVGQQLHKRGHDAEVMKGNMKMMREELRKLDSVAQHNRAVLAKTMEDMQHLETRVADLTQSLLQVRRNADDHSKELGNLQETVRSVKTLADEGMAGVRGLTAQQKRAQESQDRLAVSLQGTQSQLNGAKGVLENVRNGLEQTKITATGLVEGHAALSTKLQTVSGKLEETQNVLRETKRGLKQTNSLVLPNLSLDTRGAPVAAGHALEVSGQFHLSSSLTRSLGKA
mmetsp:Transcript_58920/g.164634  ORF Transcript_58920/g.164634 Transcript_58920/m.164634 type:complete len:387 (+) Transcript_58920:77-1237(+)